MIYPFFAFLKIKKPAFWGPAAAGGTTPILHPVLAGQACFILALTELPGGFYSQKFDFFPQLVG
jgi:hypothetical protein